MKLKVIVAVIYLGIVGFYNLVENYNIQSASLRGANYKALVMAKELATMNIYFAIGTVVLIIVLIKLK